jgi:hypothetical protein
MREALSIGLLDEATVFAQTLVFLIVWIIAITTIIYVSWKKRETNSGLALMYTINLALVHFVANLIFFINPRQMVNDKWMLYGFKEATYAIIFFTIGNLILAPFIINIFHLPLPRRDGAEIIIPEYQKVFAKKYFNIGLISFFILPIFLFEIPTVRSLVAAAQQLLSVGVCIICWIAWKENDKKKLRRWLLVAFSFPVVTVLVHGFLGIGTTMTMVIVFFIIRFFKLSLKTLLIGVVLAYLGLSVYLAYMRDRPAIRETVWEEKSLFDRVNAAKNILLEPIWFNPFDLSQLEVIDSRLNSNVLIGAMVEYMSSGKVDFAYGRTITDSFFSLIPRIIWKGKSIVSGSSGIVEKYTGIAFSAETSVGVGQIMEFYVNFGRFGVILGFLALGIVIAFVDRMAGYHLSQGNIYKFVIWFLPGMAILSGGSSFTEITASAGANIVIARLITSRYSNLLYIFLIIAVIFGIINKMIGGG